MEGRKILTILVLGLGLIICEAEVSEAVPMGTAFTYQGHLYDANKPADGEYDFQFKLYNANSGGNQVGSDVNVGEVDVIDAYFTVELDFGDVFDGNAVWLEIGVRPGEENDPDDYTTLSPRRQVTPTPYALYAVTGGTVSVPLELSGSSSGSIILGTNMGNGYGVQGVHSASGNFGRLGKSDCGVYGWSDSNYGVRGISNSYIGVFGYSVTENGVEGESANATGVEGWGGQCDFRATGPGEDYCSLSSIRWKRNIQAIDNPLDKILRLRGVYFNWDTEHGGHHDVGMIAEEVGEVLPEIVAYEQNGVDATGMDYSRLTPLLVEAVKVLKTEVDELQGQIAARDTIVGALRERDKKMESRLAAMEALVARLSQQQEGGGL